MLPLIAALALLDPPNLPEDPVEFSFAFFGCNRVDPEAWDPATNPSSANLPQLRQNFQDIAGLRPRPRLLFATGDLVLGYGDDHGEGVRRQLDAWISEYRRSPLNGRIHLVPIAGNHEMNRKVGKEKLASAFTTAVWNDWLRANRLGPRRPNGPMPGGPDGVADDQSKLNFSFDEGPAHFIVLNTDTRTSNGQIAAIPEAWAANDLELAQKRGRITFLLGHRNLVEGRSAAGDAPVEPTRAGRLVHDLSSNPCAVAYVCAHVHAWDLRRFEEGSAWQVIGGNGGSTLEKTWNPEGGRFYGFGVVEFRKSGAILVTPYRRPAAEAVPVAAAPGPTTEIGRWKPRRGTR